MFSYNDSPVLLSPEKFIKNNGKFPETVIAVWQKGFAEQASKHSAKAIASFTAGPVFTIYSITYENKEFAFCNIPSGGANAACFIEECRVRGAVNFIFLGSCGLLDLNFSGKLIIPTKALRDEGVSYHYVKNNDEFIDIKTSDFSAQLLKNYDVVKGAVWTTDCPYRETLIAVENAREKSCIAVDMEASSIAAVSEYCKVNSYHVLFPADVFTDKKWNKGSLFSTSKNIYEHYFNIILDFAGRIA